MEHRSSSLKSVFLKRVITENPTFRLVLGTCRPWRSPRAPSTASVWVRGDVRAHRFQHRHLDAAELHSDKIRIPSFIVVICTFVTMVQMFMHAFLPSLYFQPRHLPPADRGQLHHPCARGSVRKQEHGPAQRGRRRRHGHRLYLALTLIAASRALRQRDDLWPERFRGELPARCCCSFSRRAASSSMAAAGDV